MRSVTKKWIALKLSSLLLTNSKIENLIDRLIDNDKTYPVVCNESGKLLGEIDRVIVMKSMRSNQ